MVFLLLITTINFFYDKYQWQPLRNAILLNKFLETYFFTSVCQSISDTGEDVWRIHNYLSHEAGLRKHIFPGGFFKF